MSGIQWPDSDKALVAQASQQRLGRFSGIGRATATGDDLAGCAVVVLEKLWSVRPRWRTILTAQTSSLQGQKRKAKTRRGNKARAETRAKQGHGGTRQFAHTRQRCICLFNGVTLAAGSDLNHAPHPRTRGARHIKGSLNWDRITAAQRMGPHASLPMLALVLVGLRGLTTWPDSDKVPVAQASERRLGRFSGIGRATVTGDDLAGCGLIKCGPSGGPSATSAGTGPASKVSDHWKAFFDAAWDSAH